MLLVTQTMTALPGYSERRRHIARKKSILGNQRKDTIQVCTNLGLEIYEELIVLKAWNRRDGTSLILTPLAGSERYEMLGVRLGWRDFFCIFRGDCFTRVTKDVSRSTERLAYEKQCDFLFFIFFCCSWSMETRRPPDIVAYLLGALSKYQQ